ncbi:MAG TPA: hypothetical protein VGI22_11950, partial [Xanthobacteraceae bacterium]
QKTQPVTALPQAIEQRWRRYIHQSHRRGPGRRQSEPVIAKTIGKEQGATGPPRFLSRELAEKRPSPVRCAQETPRHQAFLRDIPSPDSEAIRESFHLESQIDSDIQEHFNADARPRE